MRAGSDPILRFHADFPATLRGFDFDVLEADAHSIFALSADLRFTYFNPAWFRFALANGGARLPTQFGLGSSFPAALPVVVRALYVTALERALETGEVWHHDYECSSADTYRLFHESAYPFRDRQGVLVINSLRAEHAISDDRAPHDPVHRLYCSPVTGLITQCCNCRRVQREAAPDQWDWVPAWVRDMPSNITSGLCRICHGYYWRQDPYTGEERS
jgi:hypothetical protein